MKDIARELGVSLMTVSKALRDHRDISEATRQRVLKCARELHYEPNWIARGLATRRTYMVGLVIPDLMHSFFAEVAKGVARALDATQYQVVLSDTGEDPGVEDRQVSTLLARNLDGLIVASAHATGRAEVFRRLRSRKIRYVLIDRLPPGIAAHYVGCDDERIGALATSHLLEQGCRRVAHLRGPEVPPGAGRLRGYRLALEEAGLDPPPGYVRPAQSDDESGHAAMRELLKLTPPPDGVFCYNDPVAAGAIRAILEAGLRVPGDIAVIGSGNVHYSDLLRVPLSTIDQSSFLIGRKAAELLMQSMAASAPLPPQRILIPPRLVVRESSRRA